jgi:hypothetical protein
MLRSGDGVQGEHLTLDLPDPEPEFLDVIDRCEEALREATDSMLRLQPSVMCRACRAPVVVKHAFFCRHCGSRVSYESKMNAGAAAI